jgi:N6-L-threonylcarbamoyladenine synthase
VIDRLARGREPAEPVFPVARPSDGSLDFSFSGLKSHVIRHMERLGLQPLGQGQEPGEELLDVLAAFQRAAVTALINNLERCARRYRPRSLLVAGGVAANSLLREEVAAVGERLSVPVLLPRMDLATDNAAMVAGLGYHLLSAGLRDDTTLDADPDLQTGVP